MSIVEVVRKTTTVVEVGHPGVQGPPGTGGGGGAVNSVNGKTGAVVLTSTDVGLGNVDNTSDANKPVSTAQAAADAAVLASANATTAAHAGRTDNPHATTAAQVGADPTGTAAAAVSAHTAAANPHPQYPLASSLATVATSGAYADLSGRPSLGTAAPLNVPATGDAASGEVVKGNDSRLTNARTPTAHTHPSTDINDSTAAGRALITATDAAAQRTALGVPAGSGNSTGTNTGDETGARIATLLHAASNKTTLVDADEVNGTDSAASFGLIRTTWANVRAYLLSYFAPKGAATSSGLTMSTARLLGRNTAGTGAIEEITLGTNLSFTGATLNAAGGGSSPGGSSGNVQTNNGSGAFAGSSALNFDAANNTLTVAGGTRTTSGSTLSITETRNAAGVKFPGALVVNTTETASASGSLLVDLKTSGVSVFAVSKAGNAVFGTGQATLVPSSNDFYIGVGGDTRVGHRTTTNGWFVGANMCFGWTSANINAAGTIDTALLRAAAGQIEVNNGSSGTFRDVKLRSLIATGNIARGIVAKTASYTVTANDGVIECDATSGAITLTLPAVSGAQAGTTYTLKKTDSSANAVIWDGNASETIDGATTVQTTTQWASITIIRNAAGTAWLTIKD